MSNKKVIKYIHEKLGEIILNTDKEGRPLYDRETTMAILFKGIGYLVHEGALTLPQKEEVENQLKDCDIELIHNFGALSNFSYQYNRITGQAKLTSLKIDDNSKYIENGRMVNGLLDLLCEAITTVLYNELNLKNANKEFKIKGAEWEKYATILLPEEEVISKYWGQSSTLLYFFSTFRKNICSDFLVTSEKV